MSTSLAMLLFLASPAGALLDEASRSLDDFQYDAALEFLEQARETPMKSCLEMRRLEKLAGIAHASLGREVQAEVAFARLTSMHPGATLRYTLSPKVTFRFEAGREVVSGYGDLRLELSAPFAQPADEPVPLRIRLANDPLSEARVGALMYRMPDGDWQSQKFPLAKEARLDLPPFDVREDTTLSYFLEARDADQNCLYNLGTADAPRSIRLVYRYRPPKWPLWTGAAVTGAALASGITFGLLSRNAQNVFDEEASLSLSEQNPARRADAEDDARTYSRIANGAFIAAGVTAVLTGALYFLLDYE
ncbi:MAG: hypothetical protein AAFU77_16870 [Myxococcota bacterium]